MISQQSETMAAHHQESLLSAAPCGLLSFTDEGIVVAANDLLSELLGYTRGELVGRHVETLLTLASRIFFQTHFFPLLRLHGKAEEVFFSLRARSGEDVPVLVNARRKEDEGVALTHCALLPVRERRKYEDEILRAKRAAEEALRSNEELSRTRLELELHTRELDQKLSQLEQKNHELTRISTILAHDLREPLRKMSMFSSLFTPEDREMLSLTGRRSLERMKSESARVEQLVTALQQYVSLDALDEPIEEVDLTEVVAYAQQMLAEKVGPGALELSTGLLPIVQGRRRQLVLLFFQLLDNAVKFRRHEAFPRVELDARVIQHNSFRAIEGKYYYADFARIVVSDNGQGFDKRYSDYVFEALRKLDMGTPGLGFGLAICRKVVENHFGSISVESEPGQGTRFTLLLPLSQ